MPERDWEEDSQPLLGLNCAQLIEASSTSFFHSVEVDHQSVSGGTFIDIVTGISVSWKVVTRTVVVQAKEGVTALCGSRGKTTQLQAKPELRCELVVQPAMAVAGAGAHHLTGVGVVALNELLTLGGSKKVWNGYNGHLKNKPEFYVTFPRKRTLQ